MCPKQAHERPTSMQSPPQSQRPSVDEPDDPSYSGSAVADIANAVSVFDFRVEVEWSPGEIVVDHCYQYVWYAERTTTIRSPTKMQENGLATIVISRHNAERRVMLRFARRCWRCWHDLGFPFRWPSRAPRRWRIPSSGESWRFGTGTNAAQRTGPTSAWRERKSGYASSLGFQLPLEAT